MRKLLAACCFLLCAASFSYAGPFPTIWNDVGVCDPNNPANCVAPSPNGGIPSSPYSYAPLSPMQAGLGVSTATSLTIPTGATYAVVCAAGANVNYTTDGTTTPTATVGMPLLTNQCVPLSGATVLANFKVIQQSATATLNVNYFK